MSANSNSDGKHYIHCGDRKLAERTLKLWLMRFELFISQTALSNRNRNEIKQKQKARKELYLGTCTVERHWFWAMSNLLGNVARNAIGG